MVATPSSPQAAKAVAVKKAVTTAGARGSKGFLLWAKAALADQPKVLAAVINAAAKHVPSTSPGVGAFGSFGFLGRSPVKFRRRGSIGRANMGAFGQTGATGAVGYGGTYGSTGATGTAYGSTGATSATIAGTPSTAASSSFANDILGAVTAAGAAATTIYGIKANLTAAQQGLPPVAIVPGTAASTGLFGSGTGPMGMSSGLFFFMLAGGAALLLLGEHDKKRHAS